MTKATSVVLARVLSDRDLVESVRQLPARDLARIIERVGLEDAGELVALATTDQLVGIFDADLWKSVAPGVDETFDDARFALWLEVLSESGDERLAATLAELPEDLVTFGISRRAHVFDLDALAAATEEEPLVDKALESSLSHELGSWLLVAREHDGWDALVNALTTLDRDHHDLVERILSRAAAATESHVEDAGSLYDVLTEAETLAEDVAAAREERRAREGFIAPSAAKSFLRLAEITSLGALRKMDSDAVTRAYFRDLDRDAKPAPQSRLDDVLREEMPKRRALPRPRKPTAFERAVEKLPAEVKARVLEELAYLANVLVAAEGLRPVEAAERAVETCDAGFAKLSSADLRREGAAVKAFRIGWHLSRVGPS